MLMIDRRSLVRGAAAAALLPGAACAHRGRGGSFTHGVASGEPAQDRVLLWTRFVPAGAAEATLGVEVAEDEGFGRVVARGEATASASADYCARTVQGGLQPGRRYYYRFSAPGGALSPTGRTATLPAGRTGRFTVAVFSCSNLPFGFFNAYAHAAARDDIDLALHLGDYIYEYPPGTYPLAEQALPQRSIQPAAEIVALADYRLRHATYRADPDLAALHARLPTVTVWDDHEITNDAWEGGAQNHQPDEGSWEARKAAAVRAYREWLPVSDDYYKSYEVGDLVTLMRLDTRLSGRDRQLDLADAFTGGDLKAGLRAFAQRWADPSRQLLGAAQEAWLARELARSAGAGTRWQFLGQQVLMGRSVTPPQALQWLPATAPEPVRQRVMAAVAAGQAGIPASMDNWGGYPAARARLLGAARAARANLVVAAGDSHNAWAYELSQDGAPAGVEFGTSSVSAPGFESFGFAAPPARLAQALIASSPELKWANLERRGYTTITFERDRVRADYVLLDTVRQRSLAVAERQTMVSERGSNRLS